jgi:hypothetical protein
MEEARKPNPSKQNKNYHLYKSQWIIKLVLDSNAT